MRLELKTLMDVCFFVWLPVSFLIFYILARLLKLEKPAELIVDFSIPANIGWFILVILTIKILKKKVHKKDFFKEKKR